MSKSISKMIFAIVGCLMLIFVPISFGACNNNTSDLEKQIKELQQTLDSQIAIASLTKETESIISVKKDKEFLVLIPDSSSYLYLKADKEVTMTIYILSGGEFINYSEGSIVINSTDREFTMGEGMYKVKINNVKDADSANLTALLTDTQKNS